MCFPLSVESLSVYVYFFYYLVHTYTYSIIPIHYFGSYSFDKPSNDDGSSRFPSSPFSFQKKIKENKFRFFYLSYDLPRPFELNFIRVSRRREMFFCFGISSDKQITIFSFCFFSFQPDWIGSLDWKERKKERKGED